MKKTKVVPIGKRLLIKLVPKKEKTNAGIILPDSQIQPIPRGTILALGNDCSDALKVGDKVEWEMTNNAYEVKHDGQDCVIMYEGGIIMKYV